MYERPRKLPMRVSTAGPERGSQPVPTASFLTGHFSPSTQGPLLAPHYQHPASGRHKEQGEAIFPSPGSQTLTFNRPKLKEGTSLITRLRLCLGLKATIMIFIT